MPGVQSPMYNIQISEMIKMINCQTHNSQQTTDNSQRTTDNPQLNFYE